VTDGSDAGHHPVLRQQISPQGTSALVTPSFTPSNGEVLVIKLATYDSASPLGAPTGGSQTYTARIIGRAWWVQPVVRDLHDDHLRIARLDDGQLHAGGQRPLLDDRGAVG
jgi:hypothetical protein